METNAEVLEKALLQYAGQHVVNRIKADPAHALDLNQELIDATVLFIDIRSFTRLSERIISEDLMSELNAYLEKMSGILARHNGFIDSLIGDAILAAFGLSGGRHADDACSAALGCTAALAEFNKRPGMRFPVDIGIGIHTGRVSLGNIGSAHKLKFAVTGNTVNTALRLESLTPRYKCSIILSGSTRKLLTLQYNISELERIFVKGLEVQFPVYSLRE
ncbi:MAG: adenylate/guanylate cyclase domain-containing protein [Spirochaetales bacterium]|nr:MAG: adenylate/guanylate cyclase domain-containing protein [Spirochaetales bacterium]